MDRRKFARVAHGVRERIHLGAQPCGSAHEPHVVDRMSLLHALTHIAAHRPQTAQSCPVWHAHHPLPVASGPLQVAPITLHCGYWLKAPHPLLNHYIAPCTASNQLARHA
jgi:hypothetical protein